MEKKRNEKKKIEEEKHTKIGGELKQYSSNVAPPDLT